MAAKGFLPDEVGGLTFHKPAWWDELPDADLPGTISLDSHKVHAPNGISRLVTRRFKKDVGTGVTWRGAMKLWFAYYQARDSNGNGCLPVFLAHCFKQGGEVWEAAGLYKEMATIAHESGKGDSYLPFCAGRELLQLGEKAEARRFFLLSAQCLDGQRSYQQKAMIELEKLDTEEP
mmetsp:Transcript_61270/g.144739  ORF Transcript_61270/g.144739 Transcript_61270/m.144739 type:complete len:176 (+) Transcript_61270:437-964(+)